jgi:hypothetical protein
MFEFTSHLGSNTEFRERAAGLAGMVPVRAVRSFDEVLGHMQRFAAVRRREVRIARLEQANRAGAAEWRSHRDLLPEGITAFRSFVLDLSEMAKALQPLINPSLDRVICLVVERNHPLRTTLQEAGKALGFGTDEVDWMFEQLAAIDYQPVQIVCADGFADLLALLESASSGELGLLLAGFPRFTGDVPIDQRVEKLVIRLSKAKATPSIFMALVIVLTAHFVATLHSPRSINTTTGG